MIYSLLTDWSFVLSAAAGGLELQCDNTDVICAYKFSVKPVKKVCVFLMLNC